MLLLGRPTGYLLCSYLNSSYIYDADCSNSFAILCKSSATRTSRRLTRTYQNETLAACPSGWYFSGTNCYRFSSVTMSFAQAQAYCPSQNSRAYLAKITSQTEMSYVQGIIIYSPGRTWVNF